MVGQVIHRCVVPHLLVVVVVGDRCAVSICELTWKELVVVVDDDVVLHRVANVFDLCVPRVAVDMGVCSCWKTGRRDRIDDIRVLARLADI